MAKRLTGLNPLAYMGVEALTPPAMYQSPTSPTSTDASNFNIGDLWVNTTAQTLYVLVSLARGTAVWMLIEGNGANEFETSDSNIAIPVAGLLKIFGGTGISTTSSGNTVTVTATGAGLTFDGDTGSATPSAGVITFHGGSGISTSATGSTVTIASTGAASADAVTFQAFAQESETITKGTLVYLVGPDVTPIVDTADAVGTSPGRWPAIGMVLTTINGNVTTGTVQISGIIGGINTSSCTPGDWVYLSTSASAGAFTTTRPTGNNAIQPIGICIVQDASVGELLLQISPNPVLVPNLLANYIPVGLVGGTDYPTSVQLANGLLTYNSTSQVFSGSSITQNSLIYGSTSNAVSNLGVATNGQIPIGSTSSAPVLATITAGTGISVTNGAGSISIAATGAGLTSTFDADSGSATPSAGAIIMHGTGDITTTATGSTVTFAGSGVTTVDTGSGTVTASSNTITIAGGTGITTSGSGSTVTITASGSSGITTLDGNSGSATGSTVTITTGASNTQGTATFTGSSSTVTLKFSDSNLNTGIGTNSLDGGSLSGTFNSAFGTGTGINLTTGGSNSLFGTGSGEDLTSSGHNAYFGNTSGAAGTSGSGYNAGFGYQAMFGITTGAYNTGLGALTGTNYGSSESSNICIGYSTGGSPSESNVLRIGNATGTSNGNINAAYVCGITGIVVSGVNAQITSGNQLGVASSSSRFKKDIVDMGDASNALYKLRPVSYNWKKDSAPGLKDAPDILQHGLIAEEALEHVPHVVNLDKDGRAFNINYDQLVGMLINEVQRLEKRVAALEKRGG